MLNVDTTNARVGIGTTAPGAALHVGSNAGYGTVGGLLLAPNLAGGVGIYNRAYQIAPVQTAEARQAICVDVPDTYCFGWRNSN